MTDSRSLSPRVTVITVTYNAGPLLTRTLDNLRRQQYAQMEVIVVDGQSADGTVDIIRQSGDIVNRWVSEPDGGIYDAMNKGVRMATGEWIVFMNAGDTFAADDVLSRVFSDEWPTDMADIIYGDVMKDGQVKTAPDTYRLYHRMLFCHQSAIVRRSQLTDTSFDTRHRLSADHKFFITRYRRGARFLHVGLPVADFDTGGVSNSHRSAGLADNIRVMAEVMPWSRRIQSILRLLVPYIVCRLRGK